MPTDRHFEFHFNAQQRLWRARFNAMGSTGEILVDADKNALQQPMLDAVRTAAQEVWRIEDKYSRYLNTSVISRLNQQAGKAQTVDPETAGLLNFAAQCYQLSDGLFDITSGLLRKIWRFGSDGLTTFPEPVQITQLLPHIGWQRLTWTGTDLTLPEGMEIDFGGIVKEYAVDRTLLQLSAALNLPCLVNLGGDLRCNQSRAGGAPWNLGLENPDSVQEAIGALSLHAGALATSGDTRRFFMHQGTRYGHILNPLTGYPVMGAPRSITVAAPTCTEAGILSTLAMLQGVQAGDFLREQQVPHWIIGEVK
ncbi:FAD:protein FMN transferase [Salinispirillum sp. LH 10-3-1]|uniref:FAD:protein FMN transferase n=1 Tax=Salinispirillum sp. LH 10-3-1 TaxID=2952525 RepID=A0AB38YF23_9GAMM